MKKCFLSMLLILAVCPLLMLGCIRDNNDDCPGKGTGSPYLDVPDDAPKVYDGAVTRITFSTNQSPVFISVEGFLGASGNTTFTVNDFFDDLAGEGAVSIHYDEDTEQGYIDIASLSDDINTYVHRVTLKAGDLTRELTITTDITNLATWVAYPYVGTFHRSDQTGERVISSSSTGAWSAEVMTDEGDFVVLNRMPSPATIAGKLRTSDPGDAESYQITENITSVSGNGRIFFRVGMKSRLSSSEDHRYTRIRVNWMNGDDPMTSYVYVRQGETADYLMRPEDALTGSPNTPPRNLAVRYTLYNVSDPLKGGGPNITDHSPIAGEQGVFTDYPSKAGYLFLWNLSNDATYKRAFNPSIPERNIAIIDWAPGLDINSIPPAWEVSNDVCPNGYRHVNDDLTFSPFLSEIRQSIFLNPKDQLGQTTDDVSNSLVGFYADGWFDRQEVGGTPTELVPIPAVGRGADVAYHGRIYYNPNNNASLFFPFGGGRQSINGILSSDGTAATYWTATSRAAGDRQGVFMQTAYARINFHYKNNTSFVRCVKE